MIKFIKEYFERQRRYKREAIYLEWYKNSRLDD